MTTQSIIKPSKGDRVLYSVINVCLVLSLLVVLYPLIYIVSCSFSSKSAVMCGKVWLFPVELSLDGYAAVFKYKQIVTGYANTIFYTVVGTTVNIIVTILAAYPLSRKDFKARGFFMFLFMFTMLFGGGIIPSYMLVSSLGLKNTRWVMIIPCALSVWNVIVTRTYFQNTISDELLDAAKIDGCSDFRFVSKIVLPLSKSIIAVMVLFYAVGHWNAFFNAFIYIDDKKLYPLQLVLREILVLSQMNMDAVQNVDIKSLEAKEGLKELLKYSLIVVSSAPVICMYPFVQKYFIKGVMIGSLKG